MKIKNILILFIALILLNINPVNAEEKKQYYKRFSTPETPSYYNYRNNIETAFFKDGYVVYNRNEKEGKQLYYYDKNGKVITYMNLKDISDSLYDISYMEQYEGFLYILTRSEIIKLDDNLKAIAKNERKYSERYIQLAEREEYGIKQIAFSEDKIYTLNDVYDFDLNYIENSLYETENYIYIEGFQEEGRREIELKEACNISSISYYSDGVIDHYFSCATYEKLSVGTGLNTLNGWKENGIAQMALYEDDKLLWRIENTDYNVFLNTQINDKIIITLAGKYDKNIYNYKSDILFYDLEGKYLGKIEENQLIGSLNILDEELLVGKQTFDGLCDGDKYSNNDSGCDTITTFDVYTLGSSMVNQPEDEGNVSGVTVINPETNSSKIMYVLIILIGSLTIGLKIRKRLKL